MDTPTVASPAVLDKVVGVLDAIAVGPLTLAELVARTGLARPTAHRTAVALERHGLVRRDAGGRWCLGLYLIALGAAASEQMDVVGAAEASMAALRAATGESVQLFVRRGEQRVCVAALDSSEELRTIVAVGASLPLERGSAGRVLAGELGRDGWVASVGEREAGVASVSAPVHGPDGRVLAAISVSGPIERTGRAPGRRYGPAVVSAARAVEAALGGAVGAD